MSREAASPLASGKVGGQGTLALNGEEKEVANPRWGWETATKCVWRLGWETRIGAAHEETRRAQDGTSCTYRAD